MTLDDFDRVMLGLISAPLILGFYQAYFILQRLERKRYLSLETPLDHYIPYRPGWVWIYSVGYYAVLVSVVLTVRDHRHFTYTIVSYVALLVIQALAFVLLPVSTPPHWRWQGVPRSRSEKFLQFVQVIDASSNCFPSMHTSVAALTALHIAANVPAAAPYAAFYPLLIAASAVFTKQHFFLDVIGAAVPAAIAYLVYLWLVQERGIVTVLLQPLAV